ncbi:MAG: primosomal protein N' [Candidatus Saccharimonadales bacterium]
MYFYEIWVRSTAYRGSAALTYESEALLDEGSIVKVGLQRAAVWGMVVRKVSKPAFKTKPIIEVPPVPPLSEALLRLAAQLATFYASPIGSITQLIVPNDITPRGKTAALYEPNNNSPAQLPPLTDDQQKAVAALAGPGTHLLHGTTGSGKTRVYIELATRALAAGRSSIILTPEISLTSQLSQRFQETFGARVIVLHSGLTPRERRLAWTHIAEATSPVIVIGARSALFSPLHSVGLIVVDEAHEPAYKQEQAPYYHAVRAASMLSQLHRATLILGTATPTISEYYLAEQKNIPIVIMKNLATTSKATTKRVVVDLTDRTLFTRSQHISQPLITALQQSLGKGEQGLLYLNRRGTARIILCDKCGWQALCPHCDLPLTYHADSHDIICHSCSFRGPAPITCPVCDNPSIVYKSAGTKSIVDEVQRLFPEARIQRFDTDNLKADRLEQHYQSIVDGDVDILVGTQLLAKGLDLPKLSTLGVIMADSSLAMPDFTSQERTYQLLSQVLGRVGRGHRDSTAIVQTYNTTSPAIIAAINDDWQTLYKKELQEREKFGFPPFFFLLKLTIKRTTAKAAQAAAEKLRVQLLATHGGIIIEGPAPSFHEKQAGKYEWQLVVKAKRRAALLEVIHDLPSSGWSYDIDPINLL